MIPKWVTIIPSYGRDASTLAMNVPGGMVIKEVIGGFQTTPVYVPGVQVSNEHANVEDKSWFFVDISAVIPNAIIAKFREAASGLHEGFNFPDPIGAEDPE